MCGGKSATGESAEQTAMREINEEPGLGITESYLTLYKKVKSEVRKQFKYPYWVFWDGDVSGIKFEDSEVSNIAWQAVPEVLNLLKKITTDIRLDTMLRLWSQSKI